MMRVDSLIQSTKSGDNFMLTSRRRSLQIGWFIVVAGLLIGCGSSTYDATEVVQGRDWKGEVTTVKDGGEPVTGTVVKKNAKGDVVEETQYKDGFPNGGVRTWYDNGQLKTEAEVAYDEQFKRTKNIGTSRSWCDNGTLKSESVSDEQGTAVGKQQTWNCSGKLLSLVTRPFGEQLTAQELENGDVVVTDQGTTRAAFTLDSGYQWDGVHKQFNMNGTPRLAENWVNGQLDGSYERWDTNGKPEESGTYAAGKKVGIWMRYLNGFGTAFDYDASHFVNPDYAGPFMQAAGIQPNVGNNTPLQDYKVDLDKMRYYVSEGLVDPKKKINLGGQQGEEFVASWWTYPYVRASRGALDLLVELGADPKAIDSVGRSRLHYCVISLMNNAACTPDEVQRLIGLGIAVDQADRVGNTPLNELVRNSLNYYLGGTPPETVFAVSKILIDAGANPDTQDREQWSALMTAVLYKKFDVATLLLEHSKNPAATSKEGLNLVQLAFLSPDKQQFYMKLDDATKAFVTLAVSKGVDPNQKAGDMGSMKEIALQSGAIDVAQFLSSLKGPA
jgi:antitoxin component YwqK of YwqJK toxin-antitoxin module